MNKEMTLDQEKAFKKLTRMKVYEVMNDDYQESENKCYFDFLWWSALHEWDLYSEGEYNDLTKIQAQRVLKWLKEYQHLTIEHKNSQI